MTDTVNRQPTDFFRLRLNSNDTYSRSDHPTNNCNNFIIEFPQSSSDSMQYRISQCNRYQVTHVHLPVRNSNLIRQAANNLNPMPFTSAVLKKGDQQQLNQTYNGSQFMTKYGIMDLANYTQTHEELYELNLSIHCATFNETFDTNQYE